MVNKKWWTYCERIKSFRYRLTTKFNIESVVTGIRHGVINVHRAIPVVLDVDIHYLARRYNNRSPYIKIDGEGKKELIEKLKNLSHLLSLVSRVSLRFFQMFETI